MVDDVDWIDRIDRVEDTFGTDGRALAGAAVSLGGRTAGGGTTLTVEDGAEASATDLAAGAAATGSFVSTSVVEFFASDALGLRRFPSINVCSSAMRSARLWPSSSEAPSFSSSAILFCIALMPFLTIGHFGRACPDSSSHTGHFAFTSILGVFCVGVTFDAAAAAALPMCARDELLELAIDICKRIGSMTGGGFACAEAGPDAAVASAAEVAWGPVPTVGGTGAAGVGCFAAAVTGVSARAEFSLDALDAAANLRVLSACIIAALTISFSSDYKGEMR